MRGGPGRPRDKVANRGIGLRAPDAAQRVANAAWCAADPGSTTWIYRSCRLHGVPALRRINSCSVASGTHEEIPLDTFSGATTDLPVGLICRKQSRLSRTQISGSVRVILRPSKRGVSRSSRTLGAGCGGRGLRTRRMRQTADGEVVWFWHLDADAKLATMLIHRGLRR